MLTKTPLLAFALVGVTAATGDKYIRYPVTGLGTDGGRIPSFIKRQQDVKVTNQFQGTLYTMPLSIGSPGQEVTVHIDTGSHFTWVNPDCSTAGSDDYEDVCIKLPRYNPSASSTFVDRNVTGRTDYAKGFVEYDYCTENVTVGSATIHSQPFGLATSSEDSFIGLIGVGPIIDESLESLEAPTVIDSLAQQGYTNSRAFSLDLRSIDSPDGSIIFGGIDKKKFIGSLEKVPMISQAESSDGANRYWVSVDSISIGSTVLASSSISVVLDCGATLSYLPASIYSAMVDAFPTAQLGSDGYAIVDCGVASQSGSVDFVFGSTTIKVEYKDIIWEYTDPDASEPGCVLGVQPDESDTPILGDSFLRAAYLVFDQDNRNVHIAQAGNCGSEIIAIGSGADAVPDVTGDCTGDETGPTSKPTDSSTKTTDTAKPTDTGEVTKTTEAPPVTTTAHGGGGQGDSTMYTSQNPTSSPTTTFASVPSSGAGVERAGYPALVGVLAAAFAMF